MRAIILSLLAVMGLTSLAEASVFCRRRCNVCVPVVAKEVIVEVPVAVAQFVPIQVPTYSVTYSPQVVQQTSTTVTHQNYVQQNAVAYQQEDMHLNALLAEARECQARLTAYQQQIRPALSPLEQCQAELAALKAEMAKIKAGGGAPNGGIATPHPVNPNPPPANPPAQPQAQITVEQLNQYATAVITKSCAACHDAKVAATNGKGFTLLQDGKIAKLNDKQLGKILTKVYLQEMPKQPNKVGIQPLTDEQVGVLVAWVKEQQK